MNRGPVYGQPLKAPAFYALEITTECNSACIGCGNVFPHNRGIPPLNVEQWLVVLDKISPWAKRIKLSGGEPTLHSGFEHIVEKVQSYNIPFTVFTNGLWSNPQRLISFLSTAPSCSGLLVSLHGASPAVHAGFAGTEYTFTRIVNNIQLAVSAGLSVAISTVITRQNYDKLWEIALMGEQLGANHIAFNRYIGSHQYLMPSIEQMQVAVGNIESMLDQNRKVGYGVCIPPCFAPNQSHGCSAGIAYGVVDPWGRLRPCAHTPVATKHSLLEATVDSLWQSEVLHKWRRMLLTGCEGCAAVSVCRGGCTALKQICDLQQDPLKTGWLSEKEWIRPHIALPARAWVIPRYEVLESSRVLNLVSDSGIVTLSSEARSLLDTLAQLPLDELDRCLGGAVIDFVGYLYERGMVSFVDTRPVRDAQSTLPLCSGSYGDSCRIRLGD